MAKKKKKPVEPEVMPEVSEQNLADARSALNELTEDISTQKAKKFLSQQYGWSSSLANAVVVKLRDEGFQKSDIPQWFANPRAETDTGVVHGARKIENFSVVRSGDPDNGMPLPGNCLLIPGDVVEMRKCRGNTWRISKFINRPQHRWVCTTGDRNQAKTRGFYFCRPLSPFAPFEIQVPYEEMPGDIEPVKEAIELEVEVDEAVIGNGSIHEEYSWSYGAEDVVLTGHFVRRVGKRNDPLGEMEIASAQFGVPLDFSPETLAEAEKLPDAVDRRSLLHRVNLTDLPFVTIDGEDAKDFDDAVYCTPVEGGGWRLLVAIADVSRYVRPGSALDRDAQIRGTSVYFPLSVVPMLPEKLSNGLCSLNPGVDRLVMVCDAMISPEGKTTAYQFYPGVIHSHARLTYSIVWAALQGDEAALAAVGERIGDLKNFHELFKALRAQRSDRGALDFETVESQADIDEKKQITGFHVRDHNDAHRMIEEAMLVANVCAAKFVLEKKAMTLFRVHGEPERTKLTELQTLLRSFGVKFSASAPAAQELSRVIVETKDKPFLQTAILRTMQRACYQPENIGHFGLQFDAYAHFTSPIRRYPDLLLHRTIKGILAKRAYVPEIEFDDTEVMTGYHARKLGSDPEGKAKRAAPANRQEARSRVWERLGIICSSAERRADDASRDVMQFLKCRYISAFTGKTFEATVTGMCAAGLFITLDSMPIEGFVHISNIGWGFWEFDPQQLKMESTEEMGKVRIGDRLRVKLQSVDVENRRTDFIVVAGHGRKGSENRYRGNGGGRRSRWRDYGDGFDDGFDPWRFEDDEY
ncbi:ribonuclease R family protein [Sutterella sp.]|uniref:ribonuclease R family protein n=1 Tax=Sutterella sp. TaxID=1981025 RepID=UPI0026DFFA6F|nr:VacB/RNase II family 3'-5' exoribonuclease [Sutterella sp.]MDO5531623.1 VacB/RNase II family 3'-5' exoribonuclease [Sutterella sp.]